MRPNCDTNTEPRSWQNSWWEKDNVPSSVAVWEHRRAVTGADEEEAWCHSGEGGVWPFLRRGSVTIKINSCGPQAGE